MRVAQAPIEIKIPYAPLPKQRLFHRDNAKYRAFGGGFGNGKTAAGCFEAFQLSMEYPGTEGLIARKTRPELKATTQSVFFKGGGGDPRTDWPGCPQELIRSFNKTEGKLTFINGSVIHFWPLDDETKLSNLNLGWYLVDQAEEVPEAMFLMLNGRLRRRRSPRKGMVLFNPNGHDWLWKKFHPDNDPSDDFKMIHAKTSDNPTLTADYIRQFDDYPKAWRERFFEGSFEVFTGQIWPEWNPDIHVIRPFEIPPWFEIIECIDHGRRNPTAVLWLAFDDVGNCFVVDEHYKAGALVGVHAEAIIRKRQQWGVPNYTVIDASAGAEDANTGRSVMDEYWDYGVYTIPSDRHPIARVNRVAQWLRRDPMHPHPLTGDLDLIPDDVDPENVEEVENNYGWPRLFIFGNCENLIEHLPQYKWKPQPVTQDTDPKEEPLKKDDHDVDALGYGLMTRPEPAKGPKKAKVMDPRTQKYWEMVEKKMKTRRQGSGHSRLGAEV